MPTKVRGVWMLKFSLLSFAVILLVLPAMVFGASIKVIKTAPSEITIGQNLIVVINIFNDIETQVNLTVRENIGDAEAIEPQLIIPEFTPGIIAARPPYFEWKITVNGNSNSNISYVIKLNKVGTYLFSPTIVTTDEGTVVYSNTLSTLVKCNSNNICEMNLGENYKNCPIDCPSGSRDNYCDQILDGKCDPDCAKESDIDCICGNNICEERESIATCPKDCKKEESNLLLYGIVGIVFISLIFIFLTKMWKRRKS